MKQLFICFSLLILITGCSHKNTAVVSVNEKEGLLNDGGDVIVKPIYKRVYALDTINRNDYNHPLYINFHWIELSEKQYAVVQNIDSKYGIIDKDGNLKLKVIFDSIGNFFNGYAKVEVNGKYGLINEDFEIIVKPIYDDVRNVIDNSVVVKNYDKNRKTQYGCLNLDVQLVAPLDYNMIYLSSEKRMRMEKDGLWGFLDTDCKIVSELQYTYADDFSNGLARVKRESLWTYINLDGKEIEKNIFEKASDF
jgi:hypothetical protein